MRLTKSEVKNKATQKGQVGRSGFWDTSAIVPLCCFQAKTAAARQATRLYGQQVVWWLTPVESVSSLARLSRNRELTPSELSQALTRLDYLRRRWHEIQPSEPLRFHAERLLRVHRLRAADALQLSAALLWCDNYPKGRPFISNDEGLLTAATHEGFLTVQV
jgi:predicted nucleic acid-binding protein